MIDTIRVKFPIKPTRKQLKSWVRKTTSTGLGKGQRVFFIYNFAVGKTKLRFTYYPSDYSGKPLFSLEVSLPKLIFGNNYQMIGSIENTIQYVNAILATTPNVPVLDLAEGILIRLDMCYNHQVGDMVGDYIKAIGNLEYPHRRTKHHRFEGAEFRAKHKTAKFYNKEYESKIAEAYGILRQETTLISPKDIQALTGKKQPTLKDISKEIIIESLRDDLAKIGLLGNSIANRDTALKVLCETEGDIAGIYYFGLLLTKLEKSKRQIKQDTGTHPRSLDRKLRKIVDAGIPLTLTERDEPLPPLSIDL